MRCIKMENKLRDFEQLRRRFLFQDEEHDFVHELEEGLFYLSSDEGLLYIVRVPTDEEAEGNIEADMLDLEVTDSESETYTIIRTLSMNRFNKIIKRLK